MMDLGTLKELLIKPLMPMESNLWNQPVLLKLLPFAFEPKI